MKTNTAQDIDAKVIPVNNFFAHWLRKINIKRLADDFQVIPTPPIDVSRYSDSMVKHVLKDVLKTFEKQVLYGNGGYAYGLLSLFFFITRNKFLTDAELLFSISG